MLDITDFQVESGGIGAGTVNSFKVTAGIGGFFERLFARRVMRGM